MNNQEMMNEEEVEINLGELFQLLKNNIQKIIISVLICAIVAGFLTVFLISKKYEARASIYPKPEVTEGYVEYSQINANNLMVNNYVEMLKGSNIQGQVADRLNLDIEEVNAALSIEVKTNTQIVSISATTKDPELSKKIVDEIILVFKSQAKETLNINNITVVDQATIPTAPVSPSLKKNLAIGALLGACISIGYLFIRFMLDTHIHNKEEAEKYLGIPMLGAIPYFEE